MKPVYLVITPFFPTKLSFRGPYIYDQVKAIERNGEYQVVVVKGTSWLKASEDYEYGGVKVYCFRIFDLPTDFWPGSNTWLSLLSFDKCLKRIGLKYKDIAVVHSHVTSNARFANFIKKKNSKCLTILQHHGYDVLGLSVGKFSNQKWHKKQAKRYGIRGCNKIDLHVGVSRSILEYLEHFDGIKIKDKYVLYNGVDTDKFFRFKEHRDTKTFVIGCVANFWKLKDQITLIKATEILVNKSNKNIKVIFVGTGYTREGCMIYVRDHKLSDFIEFRNEVDHAELNSFYNTLDLFVLPSYWDAFGCVYVEAYACGVPFITAKGTGVVELLPESQIDKWVIEPHDYMSLAQKIEAFINEYDNKKNIQEIQPLKRTIEINQLVRMFLDYIRK